MTNGDRVRSMTDEQLAEYITRIRVGDINAVCWYLVNGHPKNLEATERDIYSYYVEYFAKDGTSDAVG